MSHQVTLVPGDGIGPEVAEAAQRILMASGVAIDWDVQPAGAAAFESDDTPLPDRVLDSIRERGVALKGPLATPSGSPMPSVNVALREALGLHTLIRPFRALKGAPTAFPDTNVILVRMNTEDITSIEFAHDDPDCRRLRALVERATGIELGDAGIGLKPITYAAAATVARAAFKHARQQGRSRVTAVHKATLMRHTDGLFLEAAGDVAADFAEIDFDDILVDDLCHRLVSRPEEFDLLLTMRHHGDLLAGIGAGLIGGLGMAPGVNIGESCAVFEAVHGTAERHAGKGRANPIALTLSGAMLLEHLGETDAAEQVRGAVATVVRDGQRVTYDLRPGRDPRSGVTTSEAADAIIEAMAAG